MIWVYLAHHIVFGAAAGFVLERLLRPATQKNFGLFAWSLTLAILAYGYWFFDYIGGHVRNQTPEANANGIAIPVLFVAFALVFFLARRRSRR
jgi:hypothetical protein